MVTKIVYFDYAAIAIVLVIIISCLFRKLTRGASNKQFLLFSFILLFSSIFGSLCLKVDNAGPGNIHQKYIFHTCYLLLHNLAPFQYLFYLIAITDVWHVVNSKKRYRSVVYIPIILPLVLIIVNIFTPVIFYFSPGDDVYTRLPAFYVLYVVAFYYLTMGMGLIFKNAKMFPPKMKYTVFVLYPITLLTTVMEMLLPQLIIELFGNALCLIVIYTNMQRQEDLINPDTLFFNSRTFSFELTNTFLSKKEITLILIDVMNYRTLREIIGYEHPFKLSKTIATGIEKICAVFDFKARLYYVKNGQFRIIANFYDEKKVNAVANALNDYLMTPVKIDNLEINYVSCVCVTRCPQDISNYASLMTFAKDLNNSKYYTGKVLYAKDIYNPDYYEKVKDMNKIIEKALSTDGFQMYYQPIYSVKENRITSAEALLRLKDEKYGYISPEIFIPAAEKSGAIHKIGLFVLEDVCRFVASDEFKKLGLDYVELNLSVAQCMQDNLAKTVMDILKKNNLSPDKINLEVTETALAFSQDVFVKNLNSLVDAGLNISLDDFGSGYSNLQRIAELPFEIVKIDKSFVDNCTNPTVKVILESVINMVSALNLKIVVEGIETKEKLDLFTEMNVDYIQGYYFSKPVPESEFVKFVSNFSGVSE